MVHAEAYVERKMDAMRAHATQINVEDGFFALSDNLGSQALGVEFYRLVRGRMGPDLDADGRETDLFAGV